ncbi:monovalent cation/H+ antiporter subunit D [Pusillimonas minor]|uniref:Monovalent cation/H+ antiporter subunit D n=1 Tax=Pusillimonas minor TaxID=2697024 RepID=A0A842HK38_9BURK|nr:monovalent cation/H+ antiporter subunit D [Pusillimonas minor]
MIDWMVHLPILPVVIPLFAGGLLILIKDSHRRLRLAIAFASVLLQLFVAVKLLSVTAGAEPDRWPSQIAVYLLGDWPAPFGIVAVADRLSAIMLTLSAFLGLTTLMYSTARWERAGVYFLPLFQFLLMGLNGAFLTGDLFNLFVFFEVLLAASYGLMLHGSGENRVTSGMHYIAVNLVASLLLLVAIALIYGVTGTLNMADLAARAGDLGGGDRRLFEAAAAILGVAFLIKAAAWPLNFWLAPAYSNACPPVAAVFAIMTKVGIYALVRLGSLLLPTGAPAAFGGDWMFPVGLATLLFGTIALLAAYQTERIVAYCVIISSGTLLSALGMPGVTMTGPALFYLVNSVLATGAFFLLIEMVERTRSFGADVLAVSMDLFDLDDPDESFTETQTPVGVAIPAAMAFLGMSFIACALLITGLPPLSGFVAKFSLLSAALQTSETTPDIEAWLLMSVVLLSSLAGIIALGRTGIRLFWANETQTPRLRISEAAPVAALILACVGLAIWAGPVLDFMNDTALSLSFPDTYINAVLNHDTVRTLGNGGKP